MTGLYVLFKVADAEYVLPASDVLHMESYTGATRVPGAPSYVAGLMQVRRRVIPVVDLRLRFGLPDAPPTLDSRVVVVQAGERAVALLADSAREVKHIPAEEFHPPPELIAQQSAGYVTKVARAGTRLLMLIDFHKVIGEEVSLGK
ncbi:MAG TPA: chemotaxis protein CheW [Polyangiaceae bacterium]|nr:chemotaxis protein CheW [Polyangiaceae bacterium]